MRGVWWWVCGGTAIGCLLFASLGCSSSKDDDREPRLTWKCWANTANGTCECRGYGPRENGDRAGSDIEDADDCNGREVCFAYFNERVENHECACGDASFVPMDEDFTGLEMDESCPPK